MYRTCLEKIYSEASIVHDCAISTVVEDEMKRNEEAGNVATLKLENGEASVLYLEF